MAVSEERTVHPTTTSDPTLQKFLKERGIEKELFESTGIEFKYHLWPKLFWLEESLPENQSWDFIRLAVPYLAVGKQGLTVEIPLLEHINHYLIFAPFLYLPFLYVTALFRFFPQWSFHDPEFGLALVMLLGGAPLWIRLLLWARRPVNRALEIRRHLETIRIPNEGETNVNRIA